MQLHERILYVFPSSILCRYGVPEVIDGQFDIVHDAQNRQIQLQVTSSCHWQGDLCDHVIAYLTIYALTFTGRSEPLKFEVLRSNPLESQRPMKMSFNSVLPTIRVSPCVLHRFPFISFHHRTRLQKLNGKIYEK